MKFLIILLLSIPFSLFSQNNYLFPNTVIEKVKEYIDLQENPSDYFALIGETHTGSTILTIAPIEGSEMINSIVKSSNRFLSIKNEEKKDFLLPIIFMYDLSYSSFTYEQSQREGAPPIHSYVAVGGYSIEFKRSTGEIICITTNQ